MHSGWGVVAELMWVGRHQNGLLWEHPLSPMSLSILPSVGCRSSHGWHVPAWCPCHLGQPRLAGGGGDMVQPHRPRAEPPAAVRGVPTCLVVPSAATMSPAQVGFRGDGLRVPRGVVAPAGFGCCPLHPLCPPPAPLPVSAQVTGDRGRGGTWATLALGSGTTAMGSLLWVPFGGGLSGRSPCPIHSSPVAPQQWLHPTVWGSALTPLLHGGGCRVGVPLH